MESCKALFEIYTSNYPYQPDRFASMKLAPRVIPLILRGFNPLLYQAVYLFNHLGECTHSVEVKLFRRPSSKLK